MLARRAFLALCVSSIAFAADARVHVWDVFEVDLTARSEPGSSLARGPKVTFTGTAGEAAGRKITVEAFWDGGRNWKARFSPPMPGEWQFISESSDSLINRETGTVSAIPWSPDEVRGNPARHGFVRVVRSGPRAGRYFEYTDGTPFLWIGDTWWNWAKRGIPFERFQHLADDRAAKGFSVGQIFLNGRGGLYEPRTGKLDLETLRNVERMVAYANSRGITVWLHAFWGGKELADIGPEKLRDWWTYVIRRFGAYNVIWVLAGEYNMDSYGGLGLSFWKDLGAMIRREDPYAHMIGAHPTPPGWSSGDGAPQWSTAGPLGAEPWLDFNQSQVGHGRWRNEMIPQVVAEAYAAKPEKPIVVTEPWYEFVEGSAPAQDIRFGAWSAILSGAAGHSYGGGRVWWADVPESPSDQDPWPPDRKAPNFTLDYPGAQSMAFVAKFLRGIEWWRLEPHPELVAESAHPYLAAVPGREYVGYFRWGGAPMIDLRPSSTTDAFDYTWFDLTTGKEGKTGTVAGGIVRRFQAPDEYPRVLDQKDWLLWVRRRPS